jgi:dTDP-4-amino-4,6-dideoxygalactose transaminase
LAKGYGSKLKGVGDLILPSESNHDNNNNKSDNNTPVFHMYVVRTRERNALGAWLSLNNISTGVHYPTPVHKQPAYQAYKNGIDLSFTDRWSETVLSIPIYPGLDCKDQDYVITMIQKFYDERMYESEKVKDAQKAWSKKLA